jgi:hypothetical protein
VSCCLQTVLAYKCLYELLTKVELLSFVTGICSGIKCQVQGENNYSDQCLSRCVGRALDASLRLHGWAGPLLGAVPTTHRENRNGLPPHHVGGLMPFVMHFDLITCQSLPTSPVEYLPLFIPAAFFIFFKSWIDLLQYSQHRDCFH